MRKKMHSGSNNSLILAAVQACDLPDGASHAWLCEKTGVSPLNMTKSLCYLAKDVKRIYLVKFGKWVKYFPSIEAMEAAAPALAAFQAQLKERKKQIARAAYLRQSPVTIEKRRARAHAKHLAKLASRPPKVVKVKEPKPPKPAKVKKQKLDAVGAPVRAARPIAGGPARLAGEPVITEHTKITRAPPMPERIWRTNTHGVLA